MAQTEEMKRHLRDGKIIGYKWTLPFGEAIKIYPEYQVLAYPGWDVLITLHSEDGINWRRKGNIGFADSIELGIKVDDVWKFGEFIRNNQKKAATFGLFRFKESTIHEEAK